MEALKEYWEEFYPAKQALLSWYEEAETARRNHTDELKQQYRNAYNGE